MTKPQTTPPNGQAFTQIPPVTKSLSQTAKELFRPANEEPTEGQEDSEDTREKVVCLNSSEVAVDFWHFAYSGKGEKWKLKGLYNNAIVDFLHRLGYAKRYSKDGTSIFYLRDQQHIIDAVLVAHMQDYATQHVDEDQQDIDLTNPQDGRPLTVTYLERKQKYRAQVHLIFNDRFMWNLNTHTVPFLRDTRQTAYYPFQNGVVKVTGSSIECVPYTILEGHCIWRSQVIARSFVLNTNYQDCHFARFIRNVCEEDDTRIVSMMTGIGYILHGFNDPARSQAVLLYDKEITSVKKPEGGTGKGVILNSVKQMVPTVIIDAKRHDDRQRFNNQAISEDTRVIGYDDPRHDFFNSLFSQLSEGVVVEKKGTGEYRFDPTESPKMVIASNIILSNEGSSNRRRQFIVELGPYYKDLLKTGMEQPIRGVHGCTFFSEEDWDAQEWAAFDRFMIECVRLYLERGLVPYALKNVASNRFRQLAGDDFYEWVTGYNEGQGFDTNTPYDSTVLYQQFKAEYQLDDMKGMKQRGFTDRLKMLAESNNWEFVRSGSNTNNLFYFSAN